MAQVSVRYWAGAREAAGLDQEELRAESVADALAQLAARPHPLPDVVARSSVLLDGRVFRTGRDGDVQLVDGQVLEVLPPFAGG